MCRPVNMRLPVTLLCSAQFIVVLDATIVAVALPDISQTLGMSPESLQWVVTAYTLTFGGLLIAAGGAAAPARAARAGRARAVARRAASATSPGAGGCSAPGW